MVNDLFEFLSNDEFKFVKIVKRLGCNGLDHTDDAPFGRMAALRAAGGDLFFEDVHNLGEHVCSASLTQFNAS